MILSEYNAGHSSLKTAHQVLETFCETYNIAKVKLVLLGAFQGYALNDKKGFPEPGISEKEVAEVFDGLIELVGAVRTLIEHGEVDELGPKA